MPFVSKRASEDASNSGSSRDGYLNPHNLDDGDKVRFSLLQEAPWECFLLWGHEDGNIKAKRPFRFSDDPSPEDIDHKLGEKYVRPLNRDGNAPEPVKLEQCVAVYNHEMERVQVLAWTQKTITSAFDAISQLEDYEDSFLDIDFILSRKGTGTNTEYNLTPLNRKKGLTTTIDEEWEKVKKTFKLERLLDGGDPFKESD